jgi:glycosyltransferase involved in cell wall biosynthesis
MSDRTEITVGVVGGTRLPGNVRTFLTNLCRLLVSHPQPFELKILLSDHVTAPKGYEQYDPGMGDPKRAISTFRSLTAGATSYARHCNIDLLFQVTMFPLHGAATAIAGNITNTPILTRFAGDNFREFRFSSGFGIVKTFGLNNVLGRIPLKLSDRTIALGPYGRSEIVSRSRNLPVSIIPQPIDQDTFYPVSKKRENEIAAELGFPGGVRTFLTVGRLTERKGAGTVIKTAEQLTKSGEPFRWYIAGEGPIREQLASTPNVEPLGKVDHDAIADYYRAADLLVHPSLIDGLPNVLLEAAACGTPSLARDVGDCAVVASRTFSKTDELSKLLSKDIKPTELGNDFDMRNMGKKYVNCLSKVVYK